MLKMQSFCVALLVVCLANPLFSQTFMPLPNAVLLKEVQFDQANECYIYFNNPGGDSLRLRWRLIESNLPQAWDADLCDYGLCYIGIPSNGLMSAVYDTIQPYLKLIVQPGNTPGATWIWFRVNEEGNQSNFVDVFFSLHTPGTLSTSTQNEPGLQAFPNPVNEQLFLQNLQSGSILSRITNTDGRLVWQGMIPANNQQQVMVNDWPAGVYFLQHGNRVQKILIQK